MQDRLQCNFPQHLYRSQPEVVLLVHALKHPPAKPFHVSYWALQYQHSLFQELVQKFEHLVPQGQERYRQLDSKPY